MKKLTMIVAVAFLALTVNAQEAPKKDAAPAKKEAAPAKKTDAKKADPKKTDAKKDDKKAAPAPAAK